MLVPYFWGALSTGVAAISGDFGDAVAMAAPPTSVPFRGSAVISAGLITRARLRGDDWRRLLPDVYVHRDVPIDHRIWCIAAGLLLPTGAAIGGLSAAYLWGADLIRPDALVSVVTPRDRRIRGHSRMVPHYTLLGEADVTTLGPPVTTPERTAFDLARRLRRTEALVAVDALAGTGRLDLPAVSQLVRERRHWPRTAQAKEVIRLADSRAGSPMETRLRLLIHDAGLPAPEPQYEVRDEHGHLIGRVDLGWPAKRVAAEYEGDHHRNRDQFRHDLARANELRMAGWIVLRFTANDVLRNPQKTAAMIAVELARH
ncbi:hypothetical protein FB565_000964 [Actinoplanes lutulentus]|uniref:DUF559 domain-containing protein n=1 Tax=Actinoplanes lutulentus TaxID=1287878 RepID=UPI0018263359|nr:DUF559 domain-containing protein [Actinoplanes lutulentus]MBB2941260.1 hypothetical protein [Actinoplanes lutulentus]